MKIKLSTLCSLALLSIAMLAESCTEETQTPTDPPVIPQMYLFDEAVVEGNALLFTISMDTTSQSNVIVSYNTADGSAFSPRDYTATAGTDTIAAGSTSVTVLVPTVDDDSVEIAETFLFRITQANGVNVTDSSATGTITDNEVPAARFSTDIRGIVIASCASVGCHGGGSSQGGLALGSVTYNEVISATGTNTELLFPATNGLVVVPYDTTSTLYTKTTANPPFGNRMPSDGPPFLTTNQQVRIREWIREGALNN